MFFQDPRQSGQSFGRQQPQSENPSPEADAGMFYVDFGPLFGEEIHKVLRYRASGGMLAEIVFWQDGYAF